MAVAVKSSNGNNLANEQKSRKKLGMRSASVKIRNRRKLGSLAAVMVVFAVGLVICYRHVIIYGQGIAIQEKSAQLKDLRDQNMQAQLEIERSDDLKKIEEYAMSELGMVKPQRHQIIYITPAASDRMEKASINRNVGSRNIFAVFASALGSAWEYFR